MTDDNVTRLEDARAAYDAATKHKPRGKGRGGSGGSSPPPEPPDTGRHVPPTRLPWDSPVQALGVNGREFFFLNVRGQFIAFQDKDLGRLAIIGCFGGVEYLREQWPKFDRSGKFVVNFDHGAIGEVLIQSCSDKGIWSPEENVRGVGTWSETAKDGSTRLVMHCGDKLFLSDLQGALAPGLRDKLLYPAAPAQPHPEPGKPGEDGPAKLLLTKLKTWNWVRGRAHDDIDAKMHLGWMMGAMLGAAPDWRAMEWITGGSAAGKSTLMKLTRWVFGDRAMIKSEDATPAGVKQKVSNTSLAVSLDELESEGKGNDRAQSLIKLARIASSGGESLRGTPGGSSLSFVSRNAFQFSSIVIPSMPQQDKNRMFIGSLLEVEWDGSRKAREPGEDIDEIEDDESEDDSVLGAKAEWERVGRQLRGRALSQWHRHKKTLRAYRKALEANGHNARGCDQFGALGAAYDLAMFDGLDGARAEEWARALPAATLAETSGYSATHEACLSHLLGAPIEAWRGGVKESIARVLRKARDEMTPGSGHNEQASYEALSMHGVKVIRDERDASGKAWWIAVSHTHSALGRIFQGTDWSGVHGAPGAWAQMMARCKGAVMRNGKGNPLRLRFDAGPQYCTMLPWEIAFPPTSDSDDDAEFKMGEKA